MMDMEYNRTSPFISNCLHYSSEFHPYVGEFGYICILCLTILMLTKSMSYAECFLTAVGTL